MKSCFGISISIVETLNANGNEGAAVGLGARRPAAEFLLMTGCCVIATGGALRRMRMGISNLRPEQKP